MSKYKYWTCQFCGNFHVWNGKYKYCNCSKMKQKTNKEEATRLVSYYFSQVAKHYTTKKKYLDDEFYCYEQISKGYAMLDVCQNEQLNKNQKNEMYKLIREL